MFSRIVKLLGVRTVEILAIVLLIVFLPNIPPPATISKPYILSPTLPFEGTLALNKKLNNAEISFKGVLHGPEAFAVYNNELYTTVLGGDVVKIDGKNFIPITKFGKRCKGQYQEHICGRPLGLTFDKNGMLYVCDAYYGVFKVDIKSGKKEQLVSMDVEINNKKPKLPNSIALASNGDFYWTDSSTESALYDGVFDMLSDGSGRVIHYDVKTKKNKVLLENLLFSNGIYLSKDESFLVIAESGKNRLVRYYLKGPLKGTHDVFVDGLPGFPDNLQSDGKGGIFAPLVLPIDSENPQISQSLSQFPLVRRFLARILGLVELTFKLVDRVYPNEWAEKAVHFVGSFHAMFSFLPVPNRVTILHISEDGRIIESFHALDGKISSISDAIVFKDVLYLGSPTKDYLAHVSLDKADLKHLAVSYTQTKPQPTVTTKPPTKAPPAPSKTAPPPPKETPPPPKTTPPPPPPSKAAPPPPKPTTPPVKTEAPKVKPAAEEVKTTPPPAKEVPRVGTPTTTTPTQKPKTQDAPKTKPPTTTEAPKAARTTTDQPTVKTPSDTPKTKPATTTDSPKVKPSTAGTLPKTSTPTPSKTDTNIPKESTTGSSTENKKPVTKDSTKSETKEPKIKNEL